MSTNSHGRRRPMLLDDGDLEYSSVVANNAMNRERQLDGVNSYARELGFSPVEFLRACLDRGSRSAAWLDLCCGSGLALIKAGEQLGTTVSRVALVGVDLVDVFAPVPAGLPVELITASVTRWWPQRQFDLITCV